MTFGEVILMILLLVISAGFIAFVIYHFVTKKGKNCPVVKQCDVCPRCPVPLSGSAVGMTFKTSDPVINEMMKRIQAVLSSIQIGVCTEIRIHIKDMRAEVLNMLTQQEELAPISCDQAKDMFNLELQKMESNLRDAPFDVKGFIAAMRQLNDYTIDRMCANGKLDIVKTANMIADLFEAICH